MTSVNRVTTTDETGNQSKRHQKGTGIRAVDEVANADGDAHQDLRRDAAVQGEPTARAEIQHASVLVHRQGGKPYRRVLYAANAREDVQVRPPCHQRDSKQ